MPADVRAVQSLLKMNGALLTPSAPASISGVCDGQTIFLIEQFQKRVMNMPNPSGRVDPGSSTLYGLDGQSGPAEPRDKFLKEALDLFYREVANFAMRFIPDAAVREEYVSKAMEAAGEILQEVSDGTITAAEGAQKAHAMRNALLDAARLKSSDIAAAVAEAEKQTGLTFEQLLAKYANKLFNKEFAALEAAEQDAVFLEIVKAAGRPNPKFTGLARNLGKVGKGLIIISV